MPSSDVSAAVAVGGIVIVVVALWLHFYLQPQYFMELIQACFDRNQVIFFSETATAARKSDKICRPRVALTIDDAPTQHSHALLDVLKRHDVKATFFVISGLVPGREDVLNRMVEEGHELANHTQFDTASWMLSQETFESALMHCERTLATYQPPPVAEIEPHTFKWFRPGHGIFTTQMLQTLKKQNYRVALGNCFPNEANGWWKGQCNSPWINSIYLNCRVRAGCIVVVHDREWTIDTFERCLEGLSQRFTIGTLSSLVRAP